MDDIERPSIDEDADNEFPPPRRPVRPSIIIGIIALIMFVVAGGIFAVTRFTGDNTNAVPTPTLVPGSNLFDIQLSPGWGTVFIDGQKLGHLPDPRKGEVLQLSPGVHQVTWQADPFIQHCVLIVPPVVSQTPCLANDLIPIMRGPHKGLSAHLITFTASFNDLTPAQQQPLFQAAQKALDALQSSDTVQPGEKYADLNAPQFIATATTTLRATLRFQLDTDPGSASLCAGQFPGFGTTCSNNGQNCHLFCMVGETTFSQTPSAPDQWDVLGVIRSIWTYTTLNGQAVAQNQPDETDNQGTEYLVDLSITRTGDQWHVSTGVLNNINTPTNGFISRSPSCEAANNLVAQNGFTLSQFNNINLPNDPNASISWNTGYGSNLAAGCLLTATVLPPQNDNPTPTPTIIPKPLAHCLYRFGVLLALDSEAHTLWPSLPVVDAYEQGIAQHIT